MSAYSGAGQTAARRRARWPLVLPFVLLLAGVGGLGLYRYVDNYWLYRGFAPPKDAPWVRVHGLQQSIAVASPALGGRRQQVIVYLPPGYETSPGRRYPVIYLLHGFPGRPLAFLETVRLGVVEDELVAKQRVQPAILVMPFGSTSTFEDKEWANGLGAGQGWETFVARDVVSAIDRRYRTIATGRGRALAGLSEGGYGALNIGLHHPGRFTVLESWSGYMRVDRIPAIFGSSASAFAYNSPLDYLPTVAPALRRRHVYIWFYTGTRDEFRGQNAEFAALLTRYRIPHTFLTVPGGHTWTAWRDEAAAALTAAAARLAHG